MNLISVITIEKGVIHVVAGTWEATEAGIKVAEKVFLERCQGYGSNSDDEFDVDGAIDDGYYSGANFSVCLTHHELTRI